jgi:hypothetical protein
MVAPNGGKKFTTRRRVIFQNSADLNLQNDTHFLRLLHLLRFVTSTFLLSKDSYSTSRYKINERSTTYTVYVKLIKLQRNHSAVPTKSINRRTKEGYRNRKILNILRSLSVLAYSSLQKNMSVTTV